jgi:hypothetical protein
VQLLSLTNASDIIFKNKNTSEISNQRLNTVQLLVSKALAYKGSVYPLSVTNLMDHTIYMSFYNMPSICSFINSCGFYLQTNTSIFNRSTARKTVMEEITTNSLNSHFFYDLL